MHKLGLVVGLVVGVVLCVGASVARAEDYEATGGTEKAYRHGGQLKIYSQVGSGYRLIFPFNKGDYCGDTSSSSSCKDFEPFWIELGVGYGITDSLEILTDVRLGLGADFKNPSVPGEPPHQFVI